MGRLAEEKDFIKIVKDLVSKSTPVFIDGCITIEIERGCYYLYCYDWFDGITFEYTLADARKSNYTKFDLPDDVINYLKSELKRFYDEKVSEMFDDIDDIEDINNYDY